MPPIGAIIYKKMFLTDALAKGVIAMRANLRAARKKAGMTQKAFANALNISRSYYSQIEGGTKDPSYRVVLKIKLALHISEDSLFDLTEKTAS